MFSFNCKGKLIAFNNPIVMGIINYTADSFYKESRQHSEEDVMKKAEQMVLEGATILDIGAQSTRPNSKAIGASIEIERVVPIIQLVKNNFPQTLVSIDTYHAVVAQAAIQSGADIVNDISGGTLDENILATVAALRVPYICTHIQGIPSTMQQNPIYNNVTREVLDFFIQKIEVCKKQGIYDIAIDPGFGFGKTIAHNFQLMQELSIFTMLKKPIVVGVSRKSMICKTLNTTPENASNGTTVLHTIALSKGADILRTHDVKEAMEAIQLTYEVQQFQ